MAAPHIVYRGLFQEEESAESWLAWDGRWDGQDTPYPAPAVPRTFRCCRRAVAALLFFCKWEEQQKSRLSDAHSPFCSPSPCNPVVRQGPAVLPGSWLQLEWIA